MLKLCSPSVNRLQVSLCLAIGLTTTLVVAMVGMLNRVGLEDIELAVVLRHGGEEFQCAVGNRAPC